jgi:hypothetical protein
MHKKSSDSDRVHVTSKAWLLMKSKFMRRTRMGFVKYMFVVIALLCLAIIAGLLYTTYVYKPPQESDTNDAEKEEESSSGSEDVENEEEEEEESRRKTEAHATYAKHLKKRCMRSKSGLDLEFDPEEADHDTEFFAKNRLIRMSERALRSQAQLHIFGRDGVIWWIFMGSWKVFVFYAVVCSLFFLRDLLKGVHDIHEDLDLLDDDPLLAEALQFLAALLVGLDLQEAVGRYKVALLR